MGPHCVAFVVGCVALANAYIPGAAPRNYADNEKVALKVNNLNSVETQLPYEHYSVAYCKPDEVAEVSENLGEIMSGERIFNSAYDIHIKKDEACKLLCTKELTTEELAGFESKIRENYNVHWVLDNLPVASLFDVVVETGETESITAMRGFQMGYVQYDEAFLFNHVKITLTYYENAAEFEGTRITGFEVNAYSDQSGKCEETGQPLAVSGAKKNPKAKFTYTVEWKKSDVGWGDRWEVYLRSINRDVHWVSAVNSISLSVILSGLIASVLLRSVKADLLRYSALDELTESELEGSEDGIGWKQVHGDVFRTPIFPSALVVLLGTGAQILAMTLITLTFACFGLLSPANSGALSIAFIVIFILMGVLAGYVGARMHKTLGMPGWKRNALRISTFFPGSVFTMYFVVNLFVWAEGSSAAVPFGTLVVLLLLWVGISLPLTMVGAYVGSRQSAWEYPVRVTNFKRAISTEPWYLQYRLLTICAASVPFVGGVMTEVFLLMTSVWEHQFYYMFGVLTIVVLFLFVICAQVSMFVTYYVLNKENYHWWWRSFFASGCSALYLMISAVVYFYHFTNISRVSSTVVYFGYMTIACFAFGIATGTIGFLAAFVMVRYMFRAVKVD